MSDHVPVKRQGMLACAVTATLLVAACSAQTAQAAQVLPLPKMSAETFEVEFQGRPVMVLHSLLLRRVHGKVSVSCNACERFSKRKTIATKPSPTSRRYRHANWILRKGRAVKVKVTRPGWIGRYLMLTVKRRSAHLRLVYETSGCLSRHGARMRCPRTVEKPPPIVVVPNEEVEPPLPPPPPPPPPPGPVTPPPPAVPMEGVVYGINLAGELMHYRHVGREEGTPLWTPAKKVASGWGSFTRVVSGGSGVIYTIQPNGELMWYRHTGRADGSPAMLGPKQVGNSSWGGFKDLFSGGGGVLYGITPAGDLYWYLHGGFLDGTWSGMVKILVGKSWDGFKDVFSGGDGIIYAIQPNGDLLWYRHAGYRTGVASMGSPKKVGSGWGGFREVFSGGNGIIYGVQTNGDLMWYRHLGREDGTWRWQYPSGKKVGISWAGFTRIVAAPE